MPSCEPLCPVGGCAKAIWISSCRKRRGSSCKRKESFSWTIGRYERYGTTSLMRRRLSGKSRSYGLVQQFKEPLARGFFDHLNVRLVLAHDRDLVVVDDRLTSAPLSTRLHGHEAALGPRRDRRVTVHCHRYRFRQLEPPVPFVEDDPLYFDA